MPIASALAAVLFGATVAATPSPDATLVLRLQDPALVESSGLAASARHPGVLWTHADGGNVAQVHAVDRDGATVAVVTLAGIDPYDPEALAAGRAADGTPELWLGDIGDNTEVRDDISVFRFTEPAELRDQTVTARWYRFSYPDGPHDAEALLVHPRTGRVFVATKDLGGAGLYRAPRELVTQDVGVNELERVADVPLLVTDGAFLPDGRLVLRTYATVHLYRRPGEPVATDQLPAQPQGESIAADGDRLLVGSEGAHSAVYAVPIPAGADSVREVGDTGGLAAPGAQPADDDEIDGLDRRLRGVAVAVTVFLLLAGGRWWRRRRRHHRQDPETDLSG